MSYVPSPPTLSYVSSVDVTSISNEGLTKYQILFDASLVTLGNLIMFEYKFQDVSASTPTLANTSFGFISVEDATQSGIENQYIIAVPALANTYDGTVDNTIQVRVYFGITSSSNNVVVTPWSNELNVYNPPVESVIYTDPSSSFSGAYYDPSGTDTLYVLLDPSYNPYDYTKMKFVVCYFYQDASNATVWSVSDPTSATLTSFGTGTFRLITVPNIGTVSSVVPYNEVYVSIHAVYDWLDSSNNYYAVSYMSNEVVAVQASADSDPNITDVSYNVYNTNPLAVPGNQTMTVTWVPPGNSSLPPYAVSYYNLYYSTDASNYTLYQSNIPSTTLFWTVDVGSTGSNPLNLGCGDSITYRVDAITANSTTASSPTSSAIYIFKYSEAVTNLVITNTSYDPMTSAVGMTVNFDGVSDTLTPNAGCGAGQRYVVRINGYEYTPVSGLPITYTSDASYSIVYSNIAPGQTGTVEVYLETNNTNAYPASPLAGLSATTSFIANDFVLDPVDYEVYVNGNGNQDMNLSWTSPATGVWSVASYDVEFSTNGVNWSNATNTLSPLYTFDATSYASSVVNIQFRVLANMTDGSVNYTITSNVESQYTFQYASAPAAALLNWAITDPSANGMDINIVFTNPSFLGVNNGLQNFEVTVYDASTNFVSSQTITYVPGPTPYVVDFNDISYNYAGSVVIAPYVTDTNSINDITYYTSTLNYITDAVPFFYNIDSSNGFIAGNFVSNNPIKPVATVTYLNQSGVLVSKSFNDLGGGIPGVTLTFVIGTNGEFIYTFVINVYVFFPPGGYIPSQCILGASNNAGIGNGFATIVL